MIFRPIAIEKISIAFKPSINLLNMHRFLSSSTENVSNKRVRTESPSELRTCSNTGTASGQVLSPILTPTILSTEDIKIAQTIVLDNWTSYSGIMYKFRSDVNAGNEVVAFDMDGTLIKTKSGKNFPVYEDDWMLWDPTVKKILHQLHKDKKHLVIISNQNGITVNKVSRQSIQTKVDKIIQTIGIPMDFICAIEDDRFRKPRTGMWEFIQQARFPQLSSSSINHIYVGDAAGRVKEGTRSKDFANSDYKFALNIGHKFATPEQFFLNSTSRLHCQLPHPSVSSDPQRLCDVMRPEKSLEQEFFLAPESRATTDTTTTTTTTPTDIDSLTPIPSSVVIDTAETNIKPEIVLLVAPPACGKTTLSRRFEQGGYIRINQDTLGSIDKCLEAARKELMAKQRHSVCVDNTNTDIAKRQKWIELAKQCDVQIRAVSLRTPKEVCSLLASFRLLDPTTLPEDRRKIEKIVINTYYKNAVFPTLREGFYRVDDVVPELIPPTNLQALRFFHMYLKA